MEEKRTGSWYPGEMLASRERAGKNKSKIRRTTRGTVYLQLGWSSREAHIPFIRHRRYLVPATELHFLFQI
ncbi:hypothetical protein RUM43_011803 [Polyplax serrata]|uniref:Uncharacterized protein n=1 Tax=Polyplax serrata TaxID=468196 RepID=A0AAN8P1K4_POLSC